MPAKKDATTATDTEQIVVTGTDTDTKKAKAGPKPKAKYGDRGSGKKGTSFWLDPSILEKLANRADGWSDNNSKNGRLENDLLTLWSALDLGLAYAAQQITRNEAKGILDVMNGTWYDATHIGLVVGGGIAINVQDGININQIDKKWEFDGPALIRKLGSMDRLSLLGIMDWVRMFWAHHEDIDLEEYVSKFQPDPE